MPMLKTRRGAAMSPTSILLHRGKIRTMSPAGTVEAIALRNERIVAIGDLATVRDSLDGEVMEVDLHGKTALPGFIDAHSHPLVNAYSSRLLDLSAARSLQDMVEIVALASQQVPSGEYVRGIDMDYTRFDRLPTRWDLDKATASHPVILYLVGGHFVLANSAALEARGVTADISDPQGGHFVRDQKGRLTGLCLDAATNLVVPPGIDIGCHGPNLHASGPMPDLAASLAALYKSYVTYGITTIVDAQVSRNELLVYQRVRREGGLCIRTVCLLLSHQLDDLLLLGIEAPLGDDWLRIGGVKFYVDGTLNGGTVAFSEAAMPGRASGTEFPPSLFWAPDELVGAVERAHSQHLPVALHCHGDIAIEMAVSAVEAAVQAHGRGEYRHRFEHGTYPTPEHLERMANIGITAVVQPVMVHNYGDVLLERFGPAANRFMPYREEIEHGIPVVLSGDNILPYEPLKVMHWSVNRRTPSGVPIGDEQSLTIDEAIRGYTSEAARTIGMEDSIGSLEAGKLADVVVVDGDPWSGDADALDVLAVDMTIIGGEVVWQRD